MFVGISHITRIYTNAGSVLQFCAAVRGAVRVAVTDSVGISQNSTMHDTAVSVLQCSVAVCFAATDYVASSHVTVIFAKAVSVLRCALQYVLRPLTSL